MNKYTAEFVEAEVEVAMSQGKHGTAAMFREFAALLRERESAKAAVTDEMVNIAWELLANHEDNVSFLSTQSVRAALEAIAPMLASVRVPEGWMLVPVMPTPKMLGAMRSTSINRHSDMYQAALAAAPKPETEE